MIFNIPVALTLVRLVLIPILIVIFYLPYDWTPFACALIFFIAGFTDALDGYLARVLNQSTRFGAFLDPVADKMMVVVAFVLLVESYDSIWMSIPAMFMIMREIIVSALREWMAEIGKRHQVSVSMIGKFKTTAQMLSMIFLLWHVNEWIVAIGFLLLYVSLILSLVSMLIYLNAAWKDLIAK